MNVGRFVPHKKLFTTLVTAIILFFVLSVSAFADAGKNIVSGKIYEFEKGHYDFSQSEPSAIAGAGNTYGTFSVQGTFTPENNKSGVPAFTVTDGDLEIFYDYNDAKLTADEDSWHLVDDKSKKVDTITLDSNIMKGAIILQISTDGKSWNTVTTATDIFQTTPTSKGAVYTCTDMQLENGCFYRFIVAYAMSKREKEGKVLFVNTDKYDTRKYVEVYEFYAQSDKTDVSTNASTLTYNLGEKNRVKKFDSFFGEEVIDSKDIHYGWDLGSFLVGGYTQNTTDESGNPVFLKNVGDTVTLGFRLKQNIDALNGDERATITSVKKASDQGFEIETTDFGRGALIVRYTDYTNAKTKPQLYTNYLSASAKQEADTFIRLCEEGDYEVALDYEVTKDDLIDKVGRYRIYCKFSVRNSNCMVYPMDAKNGNELTNGSIAENGFRLDLAKSRYLNITVKRATLNSTGDNFVEDTRFNRAAKDGETYTDEGIYTITVRNNYTHEETIKKIAVGSDPVLKAYVTTGMSLSEIQDMIENGAVIQEDGSIKPASVSSITSFEVEEPVTDQPTPSSAPESTISELEQEDQTVEKSSNGFPVITVAGIVIFVAIVAVLFMKKKKPDASGSHGGANE